MSVDTLTMIAQIINLIVLVWLLKRFLYKPILNAIDARQDFIRQKISDAENDAEKWKKATEELAQKKAQFDKEKADLMKQAIHDAEVVKTAHFDELLHLKQEKTLQMQKEIEHKTQLFESQMEIIAGESIMQLLKQISADFGIDTSVEKNIDLYINSLNQLSKQRQQQIKQAISEKNRVTIYSAKTLSGEQKELIKQRLIQWTNSEDTFSVQFKIQKELGFGFRLAVGDYVADWNMQSYFETMTQTFRQNIRQKITTGNNL